jgi:membrane protein YqaA with SNARE-associated domain
MIGLTAILALLGIVGGLLAGSWWGFSQSWFMGFAAAAGGAVLGGIAGCAMGFILEEVPYSLDKFSKTHRVLGPICYWTFWLVCLAWIRAFHSASMSFIRHMTHHHR